MNKFTNFSEMAFWFKWIVLSDVGFEFLLIELGAIIYMVKSRFDK